MSDETLLKLYHSLNDHCKWRVERYIRSVKDDRKERVQAQTNDHGVRRPR